MKKGQYLLVETKTKNDIFGTVLYCVDEVGLETKDGVNDGVRLVMMGGSGSAARTGMTILDTVRELERLIREKTAQLIDASKAKAYEAKYSHKEVTKSTSGGIIELG